MTEKIPPPGSDPKKVEALSGAMHNVVDELAARSLKKTAPQRSDEPCIPRRGGIVTEKKSRRSANDPEKVEALSGAMHNVVDELATRSLERVGVREALKEKFDGIEVI